MWAGDGTLQLESPIPSAKGAKGGLGGGGGDPCEKRAKEVASYASYAREVLKAKASAGLLPRRASCGLRAPPRACRRLDRLSGRSLLAIDQSCKGSQTNLKTMQ